MKINIHFISDIIDGYIGGLDRDHAQGLLTSGEYLAKVEVLQQLKSTFVNFIKEANKL